MSTIRSFVFGCVSDRSQEASQTPKRYAKVKFGVPLYEAFKDDTLPGSLVDLLVYIAREGVTTADLFRRPGNPSDLKMIMKRLAAGQDVVFTNYNFYTLANVVKKFLLKIPGGIFGPETEARLLMVPDIENKMEQYDEIHTIISSMPPATQQLLALLFGTWFRIVNHIEYNTMSAEALATSIAGSLFHTCADDRNKVEEAVQILQILIDDFGVANMFGRKNIQYFADKTRTGIRVKEKYRYEYRYPQDDSVPCRVRFKLFTLYLKKESSRYGFSLATNAISEDEFFCGALRPRANTRESKDSNVDVTLPSPSSPPSPQSLQPAATYREQHPENPHKPLTNVSSLSAPEVCEGYVTPQDSFKDSKRMYQSASLTKFDYVRRRQLARMKKRSNWFLTPTQNLSLDTESAVGSRETSLGKSSTDAISSDALMSDMTVSDAGISDTPGSSDALRLSDMDSTDDHIQTPASEPVRRHATRIMDSSEIINGSPKEEPRITSSPKDNRNNSEGGGTQVTDKEVRYFMVEHWYGNSNGNGS